MQGTLVNAVSILIGGGAGLLIRGGIPKKYSVTVIHAVGLAVLLVGLRAALKSDELLVVIFSLAIGSVVGEFLAIENRLDRAGQWLESKFSSAGGGLAKGFVTASLIYCVGSMAIVGSLESGLTGNHQTLYAKSVLDGITAVVFASVYGMGVLFSSLSVLVYQGLITITAAFMKQFLVASVINQMSSVGGLMIMAIGLNLLDIKKLKIGNMLPAIVVPLAYYMLRQLFA